MNIDVRKSTKRTPRRKKRSPARSRSGPSYSDIAAAVARMSDFEKVDAECRLVYGDSLANVAPRLAEFRQIAAGYRQRFESTGQEISYAEAKAAFDLLPRINPASPIGLSNASLVEWCITDGRWNEHVRDLVEMWLNASEDPWKRFRAQEALDTIAAMNPPEISFVGKTPEGREVQLSLAVWMCRFPPVNRPRGRNDDRANDLRDAQIVWWLSELEGCGLPVTSLKSRASLAAALAKANEASGISMNAITHAWKSEDNPYRTDKKRRTRRCAGCGNPAGKGASRDRYGDLRCTACQSRN